MPHRISTSSLNTLELSLPSHGPGSDVEDEIQQTTETGSTGRVSLSHRILRESTEALRQRIRVLFQKCYHQDAKELQVLVVELLVKGHDVFFHAGTGFGKTRIAETFFWLFGKRKKPLYIVLNPLDALGDNQVTEKKDVGISAYNCISETFTDETVKDIQDGAYTVLYVSPEIFLHNELFKKMYFSQWFRNRLIAKVIDEAHMIYRWGMVESGKRGKPWMKSVQDAGIFRPSYGKMGMRLAATDKVPMLLMSATCPPEHRDLIYANLRIRKVDIKYVEGELARPEITILRLPMQHAKSTLNDLKSVFNVKTKVTNNQIQPTLIYTNTRKKTMTALKVLNKARGVVKGEYNPISTFARRFHSNTGPTDKVAVIADFSKGLYPVIACTLALGLGQNWTRVREVIQMGRADSAAVSQILGRCGRNGKPGLAVFYVEKIRNKGKNAVADFKDLIKFTDDDLMDGLAVTPVCLRIAFALSNLLGKIPMSEDEEIYVVEKARQSSMCPCRCSNCEPEASKRLAANMKWLTISNFDEAIKNPEVLSDLQRESTVAEVEMINEEMNQELDPDAPTTNARANGTPRRRIELIGLAYQLMRTIEEHHRVLMEGQDRLKPSSYVNEDDIWRILDKINSLRTDDDVYNILGCDMLPGAVAKVFKCIKEWKASSVGVQAMTEMRAREAFTRGLQAETLLRLQKQHEEREMKAQQARTSKLKKRKQHEIDQLAEAEAKRHKKEEKDRKKEAAVQAKAKREATVAANKRMMAGLHAGKSIEELEAEESQRCEHAGKENQNPGQSAGSSSGL